MGAAGSSQQPSVLKHYSLERQLGRGAMGSVWYGQDRRDTSQVAVKLLHPHLGVDPEFRMRFEREAHVAALLRSPYTVHLLDYGVSDGTCYLVMEFVDGHSVAEELAKGPIEPARALRIATEIARALEEAGARGVVHRDIKPENVMVDHDDRVKVTDFGIARQSASAGVTMTGIFVGTPAFAAPEQVEGDVDHRADIYSLGATLFALLSGHPPYRGTSVMQILQQHRNASLPMAELSHLPDSVVNVVRRCMEKDPRDRYQSATELVGALERASHNYAQFLRQQSGAVPAAPGTAPGSNPSTIPVPPPTRPMPGPAASPVTPTSADPTRIEPPRAAPTAMRTPSSPTGSVSGRALIGLTMTEKAKPGRDGLGRYTLSVVNNGAAVSRLRLVPTDASGVLQVNLPGRAAIPPGTTVLLDVTAQPRARRTRGPDRRLSFGVTAIDEATGATVGSATGEYSDVVASGGGNGRFIALAGVVGVVVVVGAFAGVVLLAGGGDDDGDTPTATPTVDTRQALQPGKYDYSLTVTESTCTFGPQTGDTYGLSFIYEPVGGAEELRDGDEVEITGVPPSGDRVSLGRETLVVDNFVFTYPVQAGEATGTAELTTVFNEDSEIESAQLTETYEVPEGTCSTSASQ